LFLVATLRHFGPIGRLETNFDTFLKLGNDIRILKILAYSNE
jgi:hypothetical protein